MTWDCFLYQLTIPLPAMTVVGVENGMNRIPVVTWIALIALAVNMVAHFRGMLWLGAVTTLILLVSVAVLTTKASSLPPTNQEPRA